MSFVRLEQLEKRFGTNRALEPLSLEIERGEIIGLLGHNGAGKSTTFGMILGHVHPDAGDAYIAGYSVQRQRKLALARTGAIFETPCFYEYLSGEQNLDCLLALSGGCDPSRKAEVIRMLGLQERISDPVRVYSHGMRQRLALAQALLPKPEFLLMDEPNDGLDPQGILETRNLLLHLREKENLTILFSSHILSEVEHLCDRIAILHRGRLVFWGKWREATGRERNVHVRCKTPSAVLRVIQNLKLHSDAFAGDLPAPGERFVIRLPENLSPEDVCGALCAAGAGVMEFCPQAPSLEDFYFQNLERQTFPRPHAQ